MEILRRLHARWRLVIFLPLGYLLAGVLIYDRVFRARGHGLLRLGEEGTTIGLFFGGLFAVFLWRLLETLKRRHLLALVEARGDVARFLAVARQQQMMQFAVCDVASMPGFLLFIVTGEIHLLLVFLALSMLFYLRCFPSGRRLGEAMFRPDMVS